MNKISSLFFGFRTASLVMFFPQKFSNHQPRQFTFTPQLWITEVLGDPPKVFTKPATRFFAHG
jgi:hypothetical protein